MARFLTESASEALQNLVVSCKACLGEFIVDKHLVLADAEAVDVTVPLAQVDLWRVHPDERAVVDVLTGVVGVRLAFHLSDQGRSVHCHPPLRRVAIGEPCAPDLLP